MYLTVQDRDRPWWVQLTAATEADEHEVARLVAVLSAAPANDIYGRLKKMLDLWNWANESPAGGEGELD